MPALKDKIKQLLKDVEKFSKYGSGLTLRKYQIEPAFANVDSVINKKVFLLSSFSPVNPVKTSFKRKYRPISSQFSAC